MDIDILQEKLVALIDPILQENDFDLVELRVSQQGKKVNIEVLADNSISSIDLDHCAILNRAICDKLEAEDMIDNSYVVAVSSPGLDRPLVSQKDFVRARGREVRFIFDEPVANKHEWVGVIQDATAEQVIIRYKNKKSSKKPPFPEEEILLPINKIQKATQII